MIKVRFISKILKNNQNFQFRAMKLSLRPVVEGFFCIIWTGLQAYRIDLDPCYENFLCYINCYKNAIFPLKKGYGECTQRRTRGAFLDPPDSDMFWNVSRNVSECFRNVFGNAWFIKKNQN